MKKRIVLTAFILVLVSAAVVRVSHNNHVCLADLGLENVEALAQSGEGTGVGYCYLDVRTSNMGYKPFCNSSTSDTQIYPCPSTDSYGSYSESAKDRCTK